jgi:hypothetical protein
MKIKSLIIIAVLSTAILCFGATTIRAAQDMSCMGTVGGTNYSTEEKIICLQNVIATLMAQIQALQSQQNSVQTWCHTFDKNLGFANSGSTEVGDLKTALIKSGVWPNEAVTYDYDEETAAYVVKFQEKYGILLTGYVGPKTRAKLNALYGCQIAQACVSGTTIQCKEGNVGTQTCINGHWGPCITSTQPTITVTSPNGGEIVKLKADNNIEWNIQGDAKYMALWLFKGGNAIGWVNKVFELPPMSGQYNWDGYYTDSATQERKAPIAGNDYKILAILYGAFDKELSRDYSDNYFTISAASTQPTITVTSPNGGETYKKSDSITVKWQSSGTSSTQKIDIVRLRAYPNGQEYNLNASNVLVSAGYAIAEFPSSLPVGAYTLELKGYTSDGVLLFDSSDSYFKIVDSTEQCKVNTDCPQVTCVMAPCPVFKCIDDKCVTPITIAGYTGLNATYAPGDKISFSVKGVEYDGTPASSLEGFNVQAYICKNGDCNNYLPPNPPNSYNGNYNTSTGYWEVSMYAPSDTSANYLMKFSLYCSQTGSYCWNKYGGYSSGDIQVEQKVPFNLVSTAQPATDSDSSPDYLTASLYPITPENHPDLFTRGVGKGYYVGGGPCIYGTDPNPTSCKSTTDNYTTYYDHCASATQLNEAYVTNGKLGAHGVPCPNGCLNGACLSATTQPSITVTSPNGGETIQKGSVYTIRWNPVNLNNVYGGIDLVNYSNGVRYRITPAGIPLNTGFYTWNVVDSSVTSASIANITPGNMYKVQVYNDGIVSITDYSDNYFTITAASTQPSITVTSPNGGETWKVGETRNITWSATGYPLNTGIYIELLDYSDNNNQGSYSPYKSHYIAPNNGSILASSGTYNWTIPADFVTGSKMKVKIGVMGSSAFTSDNYFTITAATSTQATSSTPLCPTGMTWSPTALGIIPQYPNGMGGCLATPLCLASMTWNPTAMSPISSQIPNGIGACVSTPLCPTGMTWDPKGINPFPSEFPNGRGICVSTPLCPTGMTWDPAAWSPISSPGHPHGLGSCVSTPPCSVGSYFNSYTNQCISDKQYCAAETNAVFMSWENRCISRNISCAEGLFDTKLNQCSSQQYCPSGQTFDPRANKCAGKQQYCPSGQTFDPQQNKCITGQISGGAGETVSNASNNAATSTQATSSTPLCLGGMTWDSTVLGPISSQYPNGRGACVATPMCPNHMIWNSTAVGPISSQYPNGRGACVSSRPCPAGSNLNPNANANDNQCISGEYYCVAGTGSHFNSDANKCVSDYGNDKQYCPSGQTFNPQQNKCIGQSLGLDLTQGGLASISTALQSIIQQAQQLLGR